MGKVKTKYIKVDVDEGDWKELRVMALREEKTVSEFVHDAMMKMVYKELKKEKQKKI